MQGCCREDEREERERVKKTAAAVAFEKVNYWKGRGDAEKGRNRNGVTNGMEENSRQARID